MARSAPFEREAPMTRLGLVFCVALLLAGCGLMPGVRTKTPTPDLCTTSFFVDYAVLSADIYRTRGASSERLQAFADPALARMLPAGMDLTSETVSRLYDAARQRLCSDGASGNGEPTAFDVARGNCSRAPRDASARQLLLETYNEGDEEFWDVLPSELDQCKITDEIKPRVPVSHITKRHGWRRVREIEKYSSTRSWRIFVPDLAIEVWQRTRTEPATRGRLEYAIVFRGTTGAGGWVSNLRILTAVVPLFWDQYLQAERGARRIVEQIYVLDLLREEYEKEQAAAGRPSVPHQRPLITAVGHSLGAGLARFVYYKVPEVTRVVGFNASPVDGGNTLIAVEDRPGVMQGRETDPGGFCPTMRTTEAVPSLFFLYEQGEILNSIEPCHPGALWGSEGGPVSYCQAVNLTRGLDPLKQHSMGLMACKLSTLFLRAQPPD